MSNPFTVTVMGDLNIESSSKLDNLTFKNINRDTLLYRPITVAIGGTAANFALAAINYFNFVHIIGKVGCDILGTTMLNQLTASGIYLHCSVDSVSPTGHSIYVRDADKDHFQGTRLLVIQTNSANYHLNVEDVKQAAEIICQSDLLVLDGYCFLEQPRREACFQAMQIANTKKTLTAMDIVPHDAYKLYDFDVLTSMLELVHIVIVELSTIRHFLDLEVMGGILEKEIALETEVLLRSEFPDKIFFLRFGIGGIDQSLCCIPGKEPEHRFTGYRTTNNPRGFGDRLAAEELSHLLKQL